MQVEVEASRQRTVGWKMVAGLKHSTGDQPGDLLPELLRKARIRLGVDGERLKRGYFMR
jgi:hypothetical protein